MNDSESRDIPRQILGRVSRAEFVGRANELARIVAHPGRIDGATGLLILMNPSAGVSELMRQAYDELFKRRNAVVPIYFAIHRSEATPVSVAIQFLNTFLLQFIAYRRNEPSLCHASLLLADLLKLALPADYEWIEELLAAYERARFGDDDQALVRFCLSAAQRVPPQNGRPFVMFDAVQLRTSVISAWSLDSEIIRTLTRAPQSFAFAGLRRQVLNAAHNAGASFEDLELLRLAQLDSVEAARLAEFSARRQNVMLNDETRDLLVQQFDCSPFLITSLLEAASEKNVSLTSYLACEELYVDEIMGGHFHRHFTSLLEDIAPRVETRRELIRLLGESLGSADSRSSSEAWRKKLQLETSELEQILQGLYVQELINRHGSTVDAGNGPLVWNDFIRVRRRLDINSEPRALVVADTIAEALKRAPHTMARTYRAGIRLPLRELLAGFNSQLVPRVLFQHDKFKKGYLGLSADETLEKLDTESDLIRLPQVFHTASCAAFHRNVMRGTDEDDCIVAHAFEGANYADENEIVWLVAQVEAKLEVDRGLTGVWCTRLETFARELGFSRIRILLISNEGFSADAAAVLESRNAFGASRQQMELLTSRLGELAPARPTEEPNEFVTILPMGNDNELIAANVVEQIARKSRFPPEAINQIKTAIVEACINAAEHSLSPDRKIYQRFRIESDRLVVTISSRGVVPTKQRLGQNRKATDIESSEGRRGWGLKLIRSLMDEVEFEQVDDGTSLRMTKYLRNSSS